MMVNAFPEPGDDDEAIFARVRACPEFASQSENSLEMVRIASAMQGYDFAVAMLYEQLRNSPVHGPFIRRIESAAALPSPIDPHADVLVAVVPGAFHREKPETGADGRRLLDMVRHCGYHAERIPLPSLATTRANAEHIDAWLSARREQKILLVSLSKGSVDVLAWLTLRDNPALDSRLVGWISLSGVLQGSPLVGWLKRHPVRWLAVRILSWWRSYDFGALAELARPEHGLVTPLGRWPPWLKMAHVIGFPRATDLSSALARRVVRRTAEFGPNDGGGIVLADVLTWPGLIYPAWRADHYLRPAWDFRGLMARLLAWATADEGRESRDLSEDGDCSPPQPLVQSSSAGAR